MLEQFAATMKADIRRSVGAQASRVQGLIQSGNDADLPTAAEALLVQSRQLAVVNLQCQLMARAFRAAGIIVPRADLTRHFIQPEVVETTQPTPDPLDEFKMPVILVNARSRLLVRPDNQRKVRIKKDAEWAIWEMLARADLNKGVSSEDLREIQAQQGVDNPRAFIHSIHHLRHALETDPRKPQIILTERINGAVTYHRRFRAQDLDGLVGGMSKPVHRERTSVQRVEQPPTETRLSNREEQTLRLIQERTAAGLSVGSDEIVRLIWPGISPRTGIQRMQNLMMVLRRKVTELGLGSIENRAPHRERACYVFKGKEEGAPLSLGSNGALETPRSSSRAGLTAAEVVNPGGVHPVGSNGVSALVGAERGSVSFGNGPTGLNGEAEKRVPGPVIQPTVIPTAGKRKVAIAESRPPVAGEGMEYFNEFNDRRNRLRVEALQAQVLAHIGGQVLAARTKHGTPNLPHTPYQLLTAAFNNLPERGNHPEGWPETDASPEDKNAYALQFIKTALRGLMSARDLSKLNPRTRSLVNNLKSQGQTPDGLCELVDEVYSLVKVAKTPAAH